MSDEDQIAYLAGDADVSLDPAELAAVQNLRSALAEQSTWVEPDPGLERRVVDAVAQAAAATHRPHPAATSTRPDQELVVTQIADRRPRRIRYAIVGIAAAVVLAAGLAVGLVVGTGHGGHAVEFSASLKGTERAPGASGRVTLTQTSSGWRIHLKATGLPRLDNGRYYEAWLKNPAGVLVPIGTFNEAADVTLWAGVPPTSFPTLTITRQTVAGGPASSRQVVLAGPTERIH